MFRKLLKLTRAVRERLLALVMLPVFVAGTLPQTACICADGHREASCPMLAGHKALSAATPSGRSASCCQRHQNKKQSCCHAKSSKPASDACDSKGRIAAETGSCCQAVVEQAPPAVNVKKSQHLASDFTTAVLPSSSILPASALWPRVSTAVHLPPPRDLAVVYSHLTI